MRILAIFKKIIFDFIKRIKKEQAIPVLLGLIIVMLGMVLVFSLLWLWPALAVGAIISGLARKFQIDTYKKISSASD